MFTSRTRRMLLLLFGLTSAAGITPAAHAADRLALQATEQVRLRGCGRDRTVDVPATLRIGDTSTWDLTLGDVTLAGFFVVGGRKDRTLFLESDAAGLAALAVHVGSLATQLCATGVTVPSVEVAAFKMVRGKKGAATLKLTARFADGTNRPGRLAVKGKGSLEPEPTTTSSSTSTSSTSSTATSSTTSTSLKPSTTSTTTATSSTSSTTLKTTTSTTEPSTSTTASVPTTVTTTSSSTTTTIGCAGQSDGTPCAPDGNPCSVDQCVGGQCTHDVAVEPGTFCGNTALSPCDAADRCDGLTCYDLVAPFGAFCLNPGQNLYPCHSTLQTCNGTSKQCPPEPFCEVGEVCNADLQCITGACLGGICIEKVASGGSCDSFYDCQPGLTCDGGACETDPATSCDDGQGGFLPAGTPCRYAGGGCDLTEECAGNSAVCPPDELRPAGFLCGYPAGGCHPNEETCNGVTKDCPIITWLSSCQASQGPCDIVDACDPATNPNFPDCPPDTIKPNGAACTPLVGTVGSCEFATCTGVSAGGCVERLRPADYVCRPAANDCDIAETCGTFFNNPNLAAGNCRDDTFQVDGTSCLTDPDGLNGACSAGECAEVRCKYTIDCPDGFVCDPGTFQCVEKAPGTGYGAPCTGASGSVVGNCGSGFFCCASIAGDGLGGYATQGQTGRCAECCGPVLDALEDCGSQETCCDGTCVNPSSNNDFCGGCVGRSNVADPTGYDCDEFENACYPTATCSFGACVASDICGTAGEYCSLPTDPVYCAANPLFCQDSVDPACTDASEGPTYPNCQASCDPIPHQVPQDCPDGPCDSDDDCCQSFRCLATCTGQPYGICLQKTCQAR